MRRGHAFTIAAAVALVITACGGGGSSSGGNTGPQPTYSISGTVSGATAAGITVTLSGPSSAATTTDANGHFTFSGLVTGNFTVTPSVNGYTFSPPSRTLTLSGSNVSGQDFVATATTGPTYTISGTVSGATAAGVTITLAGTATTSTVTDVSGSYAFAGLPNGTYTLAPTKSGYTFTPATRAVSVSSTSVSAQNFAAVASGNQSITFFANDGTHGAELWKTDGTASGTVLVKDINPAGDSYPSQLFNYDPNSPRALGKVTLNGVEFIEANDGLHGRELWKTDGTAAGTVMVKDINPSGSSLSGYAIAFNGAIYFTADDGVHGGELWKSDGTLAGTVLIADVNPNGSSSGMPVDQSWDAAVLDGKLYFTANDGSHGVELWSTNGTAAGTAMVKDINLGVGSALGYAPGFIQYKGALYFAANDGAHGNELWKTDGTSDGTVIVKDINPGAASSRAGLDTEGGSWKILDAILYFTANDGVHGMELWKTDGTAAGTSMVKDITPGGMSGTTAAPTFIALDGSLCFAATDAGAGPYQFALWRTDGTPEGTAVVWGPPIHYDGGSFDWFYSLNGAGYFGATGGLWKTDGTTAGTVRVSSAFEEMEDVLGGTLYFEANDGVHGTELWKTDGTVAGTTMVKDINPGAAGMW